MIDLGAGVDIKRNLYFLRTEAWLGYDSDNWLHLDEKCSFYLKTIIALIKKEKLKVKN
jgi:hypothetical protein